MNKNMAHIDVNSMYAAHRPHIMRVFSSISEMDIIEECPDEYCITCRVFGDNSHLDIGGES